MNRILLAALLALGSGAASAEIVQVRYNFFDVAGFSYLWGWFGADLGPTQGTILGARLVFRDYRVPEGLDAAQFHFDFSLPTTGVAPYIVLDGTDMGWSGTGSFNYEATFDGFNGEILPGRFGAEIMHILDDGAPVSGGTFYGDHYLEFTVDRIPPDPIFADSFDIADESATKTVAFPQR
ncbi:MAG TPA: hypothetical protein VJ724_08665 [Tahibacter sp.]|nr:hypothetical protein [Tahibacter sp.]